MEKVKLNNTRKKAIVLFSMFILVASVAIVLAATGDILGTVHLGFDEAPDNKVGRWSISGPAGGTFVGKYYLHTVHDDNIIYIYELPAGGGGYASLIATKSVIDSSSNPVIISTIAWDPGRNKLWGAYDDTVYLIDLGDKITDETATIDSQFDANVGCTGIRPCEIVNGLAYDPSDDTLYYSEFLGCDISHFSTGGTLLNTITPKNAGGASDCQISGVAIGSDNTLYMGRITSRGRGEIRRIDKTDGSFISQIDERLGGKDFTTVEDLTCDPATYSPNEAILAIRTHTIYEAVEIEEGTCPLVGLECTDDDGDGFAAEGVLCGEIDCDDNDEEVNPDAEEVCNGIDDDCDGLIDNIDEDRDGVNDCIEQPPELDDERAGVFLPFFSLFNIVLIIIILIVIYLLYVMHKKRK